MKIKPLLDKIVLEEIEVKQQTDSGIFIPSSAQEKPVLARVIAVGNGGFVDGNNVEILVKIGDKVLFSKYAGNEFKIEEKKYIIIKQADILAVVED
ncbi:MAG: co-chaperone GroES [Clostridia bacterium]|nr:co-chaperone GroES [Clostridia bacterium]